MYMLVTEALNGIPLHCIVMLLTHTTDHAGMHVHWQYSTAASGQCTKTRRLGCWHKAEAVYSAMQQLLLLR
jgi:hypothetical protein